MSFLSLCATVCRLCKSATSHLNNRSIRPYLEKLEQRDCPALGGTVWEWVPRIGEPQDWSNATGLNWEIGGILQPPDSYPGKDVAGGDEVNFHAIADPAVLDVQLAAPLASLSINGWANTLTLNQNLYVAQSFYLQDTSTININVGGNALEFDGVAGLWTSGNS
jgi:hypothetical protein